MSKVTAAITAVGGYVPDYVLTNQLLATMVDTNDEWIISRTGIKERRILKDKDKGTSYLGIRAAKNLLEKSNVDPSTIDLVIFCTTTPDMAVASTEYKIDVPYAVFETDEEQVVDFKEKPTYIFHSNAGIYILKKELIHKIPKNEFYDITDLMEKLVNEGGKLIHNPIVGFWIDIGSPSDYKQAKEFVKHLN